MQAERGIMGKTGKNRYWMGVLYPENMVDNWQRKIYDTLELPFAYCIHDKDLQNDGDEIRKVHVHVLIAFPNTTTQKHAFEVFDSLSALGKKCISTCEGVFSVRKAYDYLIHDTEGCRKEGKHQYFKAERIEGNNFDIGAYEQLTTADKSKMLAELEDLIIDYNFMNYGQFFRKVREMSMEYREVCRSYSGHLERLIKGNYHEEKEKQEWEDKEKITIADWKRFEEWVKEHDRTPE